MKNNFLFVKKIFFITFFLFFFFDNLDATEIKIRAKEISTLEEGNIIIGNEEVEAVIENELQYLRIKLLTIKLMESLLQKEMWSR